MEKIWKDVPNYINYSVSNFGEVLSKKRNILLRHRLNDRGYGSVVLYNNGKSKTFRIGRLVLSVFSGKDYLTKDVECNHIDENKLNNNLDNLNWLSRGENMNWNGLSKRIERAKYKYSKLRTNRTIEVNSVAVIGTNILTNKEVLFCSMAEARRKGFNAGNISACCRGERKKHKGYKWKIKH